MKLGASAAGKTSCKFENFFKIMVAILHITNIESDEVILTRTYILFFDWLQELIGGLFVNIFAVLLTRVKNRPFMFLEFSYYRFINVTGEAFL